MTNLNNRRGVEEMLVACGAAEEDAGFLWGIACRREKSGRGPRVAQKLRE